jgi:hypothetical protein
MQTLMAATGIMETIAVTVTTEIIAITGLI